MIACAVVRRREPPFVASHGRYAGHTIIDRTLYLPESQRDPAHKLAWSAFEPDPRAATVIGDGAVVP